MKIVIVGYGEMFDSLIAGTLASGNEIVGVLRHENILYNPIKRSILDLFTPSQNYIFTKSLGLYNIKARSVNSKKFIDEIKKLKTDIILVGSWSEKFSIQTINSPKIACINVHPSLLPKYRGPNPYTQTILHGETQTGVTFHLMDVNYDTGAILHQAQTSISQEETGLSLKLKCTELARKEVEILLKNLKSKILNQTSQNEKEASYYHQISINDTILDFQNETSEEISRKIRAFTPWVNCHIPYKNEFFTFTAYKIMNKHSKKVPATILSKKDKSLQIVCKDNKVIMFLNIKPKRLILRLFKELYINKFVKIHSKAV